MIWVLANGRAPEGKAAPFPETGLTSYRMKISGYSEKDRLVVIQKGVEAYEKQVKRAEDGECPLYRPKEYNQEERRKKKLRTKMAWYKPHDTVLFCPPSPDSKLAKF